MPPLGKQRHFDILRQVLGMVEEQLSVPLADAAVAVGLDPDTLHDLLEPVLYLEFRTARGELVGEEREFLYTEDGRLVLDEGHWLRDLASEPPPADTALRLLVAGLAMQSMATKPTPELDAAVAKLRRVVDAELRVAVPTPPCLAVAQEAWHRGRSLKFRYVRDHDDVASDREAVPYRVYCRWGHWYFQGRELDDTEPKQFRIDRMHDAVLGNVEFDPPPDTEIPDWFDLSMHERMVRLQLTPSQAAGLPRPHTISHEEAIGGGRVELDVTVAGDRRLDYLLLTLDPEVEIVSPRDARKRQRRVAQQLVVLYES